MAVANNALKAKQDAERKMLEAAKAECEKHLYAMKTAQPAAAEKVKQLLADTIKRNPKLPMDFKKSVNDRARTYECNANMRAADIALHQAMQMAQDHHMKERAKLIGEGRGFFRKAMSLGADKDFQAAAERKIDNVLMTGGLEHKGPTVAKPASFAPKNPHSAKA